MKAAFVLLILLISFYQIHAQVLEFTSLQSSTSKKDYKGDFINSNEWIGRTIKIILDLDKDQLMLFSKKILDRDPFEMEEKIILGKLNLKSQIFGKEEFREFEGRDKSGEKCTIRLNMLKDEYNIYDGTLRIEYLNNAKIYKIRKSDTLP